MCHCKLHQKGLHCERCSTSHGVWPQCDEADQGSTPTYECDLDKLPSTLDNYSYLLSNPSLRISDSFAVKESVNPYTHFSLSEPYIITIKAETVIKSLGIDIRIVSLDDKDEYNQEHIEISGKHVYGPAGDQSAYVLQGKLEGHWDGSANFTANQDGKVMETEHYEDQKKKYAIKVQLIDWGVDWES